MSFSLEREIHTLRIRVPYNSSFCRQNVAYAYVTGDIIVAPWQIEFGLITAPIGVSGSDAFLFFLWHINPTLYDTGSQNLELEPTTLSV